MISNNKNIRLSSNKGFTLIELLVVVAIIGALSGIVLTSLNSARKKGNDAAIKADFDQIRSQSFKYFDDNGGNTTNQLLAAQNALSASCSTALTIFSDIQVGSAIIAADKAAGGSGAPSLVVCSINSYANGANWAITAPLPSAGGYWCLDSRGVVKAEASALSGAAFACP